ncbi:MAG: type I-E CRISPR-associated protein Cas7/Cse4/CasC [Deltaproteobacteria bacterium]|nr:type I-E CRISPR-associated protein Cas7/Cse4/CasC [Deltaproteobacteria bacterium]
MCQEGDVFRYHLANSAAFISILGLFRLRNLLFYQRPESLYSLNLKQLQENLGDAPREKALEIAAHVLHMLATEVPSAKQQSFAAHNLADLSLVSFSDLPVSLANAFEEPVKASLGGGFLKPSISALHQYWSQIHTGYGFKEQCGEFLLGTFEVPEGILHKKSLEDLEKWVKANGGG